MYRGICSIRGPSWVIKSWVSGRLISAGNYVGDTGWEVAMVGLYTPLIGSRRWFILFPD